MMDRTPEPTTPADVRSPHHADPAFFADGALLPAALEAGIIGIWSIDIAAERVSCSSNLAAIHHSPADTFDGSFAAFEQRVHAGDRAAVNAAMQECRKSWTPFRVRYRLAPSPGVGTRWVEMRGSIQAAGGVPARMIGTCHDVTEEVELDRELHLRTSQQEALVRLAEHGLFENDLETFLAELVDAVADTLAVDMVDVLEVLPGDTELLLRAGAGWDQGLIGVARVPVAEGSHAEFTLAATEPVVVDFASDTRFSPSDLMRAHGVVSTMTIAISGRHGRPFGRLGVHSRNPRPFNGLEGSFLATVANLLSGTVQRHQSNQHQQLMIRELRHRSGNLFAQLLALFSQTAKTSESVAELVTKYDARVLALANAHRLITEGGWSSTPLIELLRALLAAHLDRTTFRGPNVRLGPDPAFSLSTAVHELGANAIKHGSLSQAAGRVDLTWSVAHTDGGTTLVFEWTESNGPPIGKIRQRGFGSRLVETVIQRQLNGEVTWDYRPDGLHLQMRVPLAHERWPATSDPDVVQQSPKDLA